MAEIKQDKIRVSYGGVTHDAEITVVHYNTAERALAAARISAILLVITIACVFIPILHFVLVPVFFLLTIAAGINAYLTSAKIDGGQSTCPSCKAPFTLANESYSFPKDFRCRACSVTLHLTLLH
jgi:hypothetical protein